MSPYRYATGSAPAGDLDVFSFEVTAATSYTLATAVDVNRNPCHTLLPGRNTYLRVYDANGGLVDENDNASPNNGCAALTFVAASSGTHYVEVSGAAGSAVNIWYLWID